MTAGVKISRLVVVGVYIGFSGLEFEEKERQDFVSLGCGTYFNTYFNKVEYSTVKYSIIVIIVIVIVSSNPATRGITNTTSATTGNYVPV